MAPPDFPNLTFRVFLLWSLWSGGGGGPLCDSPSGCCFFTGPWTVTRSSLRMLHRVAAFCRPLRPVLLLVSFPRSRSPGGGCPPPPPPTAYGHSNTPERAKRAVPNGKNRSRTCRMDSPRKQRPRAGPDRCCPSPCAACRAVSRGGGGGCETGSEDLLLTFKLGRPALPVAQLAFVVLLPAGLPEGDQQQGVTAWG